jgi:hypothetical protein
MRAEVMQSIRERLREFFGLRHTRIRGGERSDRTAEHRIDGGRYVSVGAPRMRRPR